MFTSLRNVTCELFCPTEATAGSLTKPSETIHSLRSKNLGPLTLHASKLFINQFVKPTTKTAPLLSSQTVSGSAIEGRVASSWRWKTALPVELVFSISLGIRFGYSYKKVFSLSTNGSHFRSLMRTVPNDPSRLWKAMMNLCEFATTAVLFMVITQTLLIRSSSLNTSPHQIGYSIPQPQTRTPVFLPPYSSSCPPQKWKTSLFLPSPSMDAERDCQLPGQFVELIMDGFHAWHPNNKPKLNEKCWGTTDHNKSSAWKCLKPFGQWCVKFLEFPILSMK